MSLILTECFIFIYFKKIIFYNFVHFRTFSNNKGYNLLKNNWFGSNYTFLPLSIKFFFDLLPQTNNINFKYEFKLKSVVFELT